MADFEINYRHQMDIATAVLGEKAGKCFGEQESATTLQHFERMWSFYRVLNEQDIKALTEAGVAVTRLAAARKETEWILENLVFRIYDLLEEVLGYSIAA